MGKKRNTAYGTVSTPHQVNRDNIFKITRRILQDVSFYLCLLCIAILTDSDSDTWVIAKYKTLEGWSQVLTSCLISLMGGLPRRRTFPVCGIPPTLTRGPALFQKEVVEQRWPHPILPVSTGARSLPGLLGRPRKQAPVMSVVLTLADLLALIKADFTFHKGLPGWARDWMGSTFPSHSYPLLKNKQLLFLRLKRLKKKILRRSNFFLLDYYFVVVELCSHVWLFVTPWTAARQASLSFTTSQSLLKLMSIESMMPSNHLILCHPLLPLPSIFPSINESTLHMR